MIISDNGLFHHYLSLNLSTGQYKKTFEDLWYRPIASEDYKNSKLIYDIYSLKKVHKAVVICLPCRVCKI